MMSIDHILINPSNDELNIMFELCGLMTSLVIDFEWALNVSTKAPVRDQTFIRQSRPPVIKSLVVGEYAQLVIGN